MTKTILIMIVTATLCACQRTNPALPSPQAAAAVSPQAPDNPIPPPQKVVISSSSLSAASFKGDDMTECWKIRITMNDGPTTLLGLKWFTPEQIAFLLLDDMRITAHDGAGMLATGEDGVKLITAFLDPALTMTLFKDRAEKNSKQKKKSAEQDKTMTDTEKVEALNKLVKQFTRETSWEGKNLAAEVKKGTLAKVDTCDIPGRVALGTCAFNKSVPEGSWGYEQRHYSVADTIDSDAALKKCLKIGGKWSAADPNTPEVARVRLKQHARSLQAAADPEKLRRQMKRLAKMVNEN